MSRPLKIVVAALVAAGVFALALTVLSLWVVFGPVELLLLAAMSVGVAWIIVFHRRRNLT